MRTSGARRTIRRRVRAATAAAAIALAMLGASAVSAEAQYPNPLPDFAHPGAPHSSLMSTASGDDDRPLLVILADFTDVTERMTAAQAQSRFFGTGFGSIADYYRSQSFGRFTFTPATETQGTANDGVIVAPVGNVADIQTAGNDLGGPWGRQAVLAANSTDSWINFEPYDTNNDNNVDATELVVAVITDTGDTSNCGGTRTISNVTVDTVNLNGRQYSFDFALENVITTAHELAHQTFGTQDQFYTAGPYDITAPTCGGNPFFSMNSWHKLHLGWRQPDIVTRDGYYDVPDWTSTGKSFLLYDPARGTNDYFLVENRQRGGYDQSIADTGMIIWRIVDSAFNANGFTYNLMRPDGGAIPNNYGGNGSDAFDADDPATVPRTMSQPWQDGTPSQVAVRAIGNSGPTMRAFFDVRGPGVPVDTYNLDDGDTSTADVPRLSPGDANDLGFAVMNTGESSGSFEFSVSAGLPAGWSATTSTMTLDPGQEEEAVLQVTPPLGARADGDYTLTIRGRSTTDSSVSTTTTVRVKVLPKVSIDDVSVTEGDAGSQDATFTVSLSEAASDPVGLDYETADGTATAPSDYDAISGGMVIAAGETSRTITVRVHGDTDVEPDEDFFVRLLNVSRAKVVDGEGRGTILTDPEPSLSIDDVRIEEEDATATFTVALSEVNNTPVSVDFATSDGTATAPSDYAARSGSLDFPIGTTRRTIAVPIREDTVDELDEETFAVTLSNVINANIADGQGVGTIRDDDRNGAFSCRATGVRLGESEYGVGNPANLPCRDDAGTGLPLRLGAGLVSVTSASGSAVTNQTPDDLTGTRPQVGDNAAAHAEASTIVIRAGLNVVRISGFVSDAKAECTGSGPPRLTGSSRVTILSLGGLGAVTISARTTIPLLFATVRLNDTVVGPTGITQRAFVLDNATGPDVVLGEARAGFGGTSAHPSGHPCAI